jgi:hypothetical protein
VADQPDSYETPTAGTAERYRALQREGRSLLPIPWIESKSPSSDRSWLGGKLGLRAGTRV